MATATLDKKQKAAIGGIRLKVQDLKAALKIVGSVVPAKSPQETLTSVRLSGAVLSGSDLEIRVDHPVDCAESVSVLLPRDRLQLILANVNADEIHLEVDGTECVLKTKSARWAIPTQAVEDYPLWPVSGLQSITAMPCDQFARAAAGVVFATDNDSARYVLNNVAIEVSGDSVFFVATDGRRLALVQCERKQNEATDDRQVLVPARALEKIVSVAREHNEEEVQLECTSKELVATIGGIRITSRLMNGSFPAWRDILPGWGKKPARESKETSVNREDLLAATRAAAICTSDESRWLEYVFSDVIAMHGKSSEKGESLVECEVKERGKNCGVKLDPVFVLQWLQGISSEEDPTVTINAVDNKSAVVLTCGDSTGLIMPMGDD
jgi:DNA polymerase-3 subunit beta